MEENQEQERTLLNATLVQKIINGEYKGIAEYDEYYKKTPVGDLIVFANKQVDESVMIWSSKFSSNTIRFDNCLFKEDLTFSTCHFSTVMISNSSIENLVIENNSNLYNITLTKNCIIKSFEIKEDSKIENCQIIENTNLNSLSINQSKLTRISTRQSSIDSISLNNVTGEILGINESVVDSIHIRQNKTFNALSINNSSHIDTIRIEYCKHFNHINLFNNSNIIRLLIIDTETVEGIDINSNSSVGELSILNSNTKNVSFQDSKADIVTIEHLSTVQRLAIRESIIDDIKLLQCSTQSIYIWQTCKIRSLQIVNQKSPITTLEIRDSFIQKFILETGKNITTNIHDTIIIFLRIKDSVFSKDSMLYFSDVEFNSINIENIYVNGAIIFNGIVPITVYTCFKEYNNLSFGKRAQKDESNNYVFEESGSSSQIKLINSDLGKTQLINFNIKKFDRFEYKNSKMLEVFVADTEFPNKEKIYHPNKQATQEQTLEQQRLALSQFKKIYENRGDTVRATQALAEEMEVYRLQLKKPIPFQLPIWHKPMTWTYIFTKNKEWWNNRSERINLDLNKFSSYYGNNWLRAATTTIIIDWICFLFYSRSLGFRLGNDWDMFRKLWAYSFEFLNPLRKADFLVGKFEHCTITSSASSILIDYLSRIIIAYFVYQTIAAFRKFGKKSG